MKKLLFIFLLFHGFIFCQEQRTYSQKELNWRSYGSEDEHFIGVLSLTRMFLYLNWQWTYSQIPTEAVLESINIRFFAHNSYNEPRNFHITLHQVENNWGDINFDYFNNQIRYNNNRLKYDSPVIPSTPLGYITFDQTITSGVLFNTIQEAISSGNNYLTLAMRSEDGAAHKWTIYPFGAPNLNDRIPSVDLILTYHVNNPMVRIDQKLSNGTRVGTLRMWNGSSFDTPFSPPSDTVFPLGAIKTIQGTQAMHSNQKYNNWNNLPDVTNHHTFTITSTTTSLTSNLVPTYSGTTIRNLFDGAAINAGTVDFKDPWFIDYTDPVYGSTLRNRGMAAPFITRQSPFYPDISTSYSGNTYKGVFLNEIPNPNDPNKSHYSVRAVLTQDVPLSQTGKTHKFYFQNWSTSGASTQQVGSNPSGYDQKAVVFTNSSAIVNANYKGTQLSNNAAAFSNSSQRKLVKTRDNWMHQVYESMGHIWIEHSTDNGSTWFLGNNGKPLDNGAGKCPSMDWHYNTSDPNNTNYNALVVAYQQPYGSTYTIEYAVFKYTSGSYVRQVLSSPGPLYTEPAGGDQYASTNANPNIAWGWPYFFALTFERKSTIGSMQPGIYWNMVQWMSMVLNPHRHCHARRLKLPEQLPVQ